MGVKTTSGVRWSFRLLLALVLAAGLGFVPYRAYGPSGIARVLQLEQDLDRLEANNDRLAVKNASLRQRIARLKQGDRELERVARDELGLVRPNDIVFLFE